MGNTLKGISEEELIDAEKKMLGYTGLPYGDFEISNVVIDEQGNYARTI